MQAIIVKYFGAGNVRGSRFIARAKAGSVTQFYDHALSADQNAEAAAVALCKKFGWDYDLVGGTLPDGSRVFVLVNRTQHEVAAHPAEIYSEEKEDEQRGNALEGYSEWANGEW